MNRSNNTELTISIVTYKNDISQLQNVIKSILSITCNYKLFIIDNSPSNEIFNIVKDFDLEYIHNNKNTGFGSAHNIAIEKGIHLNSKYHLVLNPDIYFKNGTIEKIIKFMNENHEIGQLMPKILHPDDTIQYLPKLLLSPLSMLKRKIKITDDLYDKWNRAYELRFVEESLMYETPCISGCFSFFRTSVFKDVGLYDDSFFMYFEDIDLSRRIHQKYKTLYFPEVSVYHEYERGAQKNIKLFFIFLSSALKYFYKWGFFFDKERKTVNKKVLSQFVNIK